MTEKSKPTHSAPLLAIETSRKAMAACLYGPGGVIEEIKVTTGARHGVALAPTIQQLLKEHQRSVRDLKGIAVSLGPGSWTGLRIGLAAAKAMAWGASVPLAGIPSMEALAAGFCRSHPEGWSSDGCLVLTLRHAYAEGLYAALFKIDETAPDPRRLIEEQVTREAHLLRALEMATAKEVCPRIVCGDAIAVEKMDPVLSEKGWTLVRDFEEVPVSALAQCAWRKLEKGEGWRTAPEIHAAAPLYLRKSDPELKLERRIEGS